MDGNLYDPDNISSLQEYVLSQSKNLGVDSMISDGGVYVDDKEKNMQEIAYK